MLCEVLITETQKHNKNNKQRFLLAYYKLRRTYPKCEKEMDTNLQRFRKCK